PLKIRIEDFVPKDRTYPVSAGRIRVMMQHMMFFQPSPKLVFEVRMMQGIMRHVVDQIASDKPRIKSVVGPLGQNPLEKIKERSRHRYTRRRRHHQPFSVAGVIVMNPVKNKMNALPPFRGEFKVKHKAMQHILGNRPNQQTTKEPASETYRGNIVYSEGLPALVENYRSVNEQRDRPVHF